MTTLLASGQIPLFDMNDMIPSPTQPSNPTDGALWLNTTDNQVYVYSNGAWRLSVNYTQYVASRGQNLLTNGTGLMGTNLNFSSFTFDKSDSYNVTGSFKDASYNTTRYSDELMPVDVSKTYRFSTWAKCNPYVGAHYYLGISMYDVDGYNITSDFHMYLPNTLTTLAQDLKNGDTVVYLTSAANWNNSVGSSTYKRKFIFWDYKNSAGYQYPENTYSRHVSGSDLWADGSINTTNNTITLRAAWSGGTVVAGTKLSQASQGGTYKYITAANATIPATWTQYTGTIGGVDYSGTNVTNMFSPGTASVKLLFLNNRDTTGSTVWYSNLSFNIDVAAQGDVDNINNQLTDLADDNKISRFERSVVRGQINDLTGLWLNPTDSMPTLATIDASSIGTLASMRKSARDIGVNTAAGSNYANVGTNYTTLANYLNGLSPKPWDTTLATTGSTAITASTWNTNWKNFLDSMALLNVDVQDRQKAYTDAAAGAIYNTVAHSTVALTNPVTFTVPIATIGLPEYQGKHVDSWQQNRNFILNTTGLVYNKTQTTLGVQDFPSLTMDSAAVSLLNQKQITMSLSYNISNLVWGTTNPWIGMEISIKYTDNTYSYFDCGGGKAFSNTNGSWVTAVNTYQVIATKTISTISLMWGSRDCTGTIMLQQPKIEIGSKTTSNVVWTPAPQEVWAQNGNRIQPITNPTFSTGTDLTMVVSLYGDGTVNDSVTWDANGNIVKQKYWNDVSLSDDQNWVFGADYTGFKMVKAAGFVDPDMVNGTTQAVNMDGAFLTYATTYTAGDQYSLQSSDNTLYVTIKDTDSGWGESYTPTTDEINAYFLGWQMCNGTYGSNYTGAQNDVKTWFPIGDTDLGRAANTNAGFPTDPAPTFAEAKINPYQVVYRAATPVQITGYDFNGLLALIQGSNTVTISYPTPYIPDIVTGTIKYATSLATYTQDIAYLIPQTMKRMVNAEQVINKDSIVATVTSSLEFTTALAGKASTESISGLASSQDLSDVSGSVDGLDKQVNGDPAITDPNDPNYGGLTNKFSKYYTKTEVDTTATGIRESFYQGGGMNLIQNSIGYAKLNFWTNYSAYPVETRDDDDNTIEQLGFGMGFFFNGDGNNKGITQDISTVIGQHYTLSWYLNKITSGADGSYRFYIQIQEQVNGTWTTMQQIADNSAYATTGYEASYMNYTATTNTVRLRFIAYGSCTAYLTGLMFTIGDVPIKWTLATGEAYNTYINMNINGIRVSHVEGTTETGYTMMSSDEFAGYYDTNGDGVFEKVFYLNGDETVSKKVRALNEFTMGSIKITKIPGYPDWQPASPYAVGDMVSNGANIYTCTVAGTSDSSGPTVTSGTVTDGTVTWSFTQTSTNIGWAFVKV